jgi:hypothetical protein
MDPGRQAMESAQRASESARRATEDGLRASESARRAAEDGMRAGRESAQRAMEWSRERRDRGGNTSQSERGLLASIILFPFRLLGLLLRIGAVVVVIGIFALIAYAFINGRLPF